MKHPDLNLYFAVLSHGRSEAVTEVQAYLGCRATWYVGKGEERDYIRSGADRVVGGGNLPVSRNLALDDAWKLGATCVQISDDLRRFSLATDRMRHIKALEAAVMVQATLDACPGAYLGGGNSTSNPYMAIGLRTGNKLPYHKRPLLQTNTLILGDFSVVKPCGLYFDENTLVKEDYEYTLRHLRVFGKVIRLNYLLQDFRHRTNPGGANLNRDKYNAERLAYDYLLGRWKGVLSSTTKRGPTSSAYEVVIRWKEDLADTLPEFHPRFPRTIQRFPRTNHR